MQDRTFRDKIQKLRSKDRIELLELDMVAEVSLRGLSIHSVLDVGTGTGIFAEVFANHGLSVTGVDLSAEMLAEAQQHVPTGEFELAPAESLPFDDAGFDLVFLGHVLHESQDMEKVLDEARRVAKQRVMILEWPYKEEEKGPPVAHRLKADDIIAAATKLGYSNIKKFDLLRMVLFQLEP